jgi:deoxyribonuclease I
MTRRPGQFNFLKWVTLFLTTVYSLSSALGQPASQSLPPSSNQHFLSFAKAKKAALLIHRPNPITIYCPCRYSGKTVNLESCGYRVHSDAKRARRLEWEHVVPAEAFGHSFPEWREGSATCVRQSGKAFRGRKCAETNPEFSRMEGDLYNLWPISGELNGLRSNFSMAMIPIAEETEPAFISFGQCRAKISNRKFEPMDEYKGIVARTYMYMDQAYPGRGIISDKNSQLFQIWDKLYPVSPWECRRAKLIEKAQGNVNPILKVRCQSPEKQSS